MMKLRAGPCSDIASHAWCDETLLVAFSAYLGYFCITMQSLAAETEWWHQTVPVYAGGEASYSGLGHCWPLCFWRVLPCSCMTGEQRGDQLQKKIQRRGQSLCW